VVKCFVSALLRFGYWLD